MRLNKKYTLWMIWCISVAVWGFMLLRYASHSNSKVYFLNIFSYLIFAVGLPVSEYLNKRKIQKLKKDLNVTEDITIDQLESMRVERDYQEKYVKKWKLKLSDRRRGL
ncbi:MAG: hypothetical protein GY699_17090 [Desulfobacteraceae bacterium]|nr:hypothetical protein [Desulfobacteraceae bacterium]